METITFNQTITSTSTISSYELFLGVSSDTLCVLDAKWEPTEYIIDGVYCMCYVCAFDTINDFLDALSLLKEVLLQGINPIPHMNLNH